MDNTLLQAAELLQQVAKIASEEALIYTEASSFPIQSHTEYESDASDNYYPEQLRRLRSVSLSSHSNSSSGVNTPNYPPGSSPLHHPLQSLQIGASSHKIISPLLKPLPQPTLIIGPQPTLQHWNHAGSKKNKKKKRPPLPAKQQPAKFVGTETTHKVKGILKRKFSWKNFPELENFLIGKREEYFHHSNAFNYTATQKEYNNKLTEQLLELASSLGYVFERFSFVQVRDRVRCYYKSYLQSLKKHS